MEQHDSNRQALNDSNWLNLSDTRLCRSEHIIPHFVDPYSSLPSSQQSATDTILRQFSSFRNLSFYVCTVNFNSV